MGIYMYLVSHSWFSVYIYLFTFVKSKMFKVLLKDVWEVCVCVCFCVMLYFGDDGKVYYASSYAFLSIWMSKVLFWRSVCGIVCILYLFCDGRNYYAILAFIYFPQEPDIWSIMKRNIEVYMFLFASLVMMMLILCTQLYTSLNKQMLRILLRKNVPVSFF